MKAHIISLLVFAAVATCQAGPERVACVGDSITFGSKIKDRAHDSYPAQLGVLLGDGYEVKNFGVSGATMLKKGDKPYWKQKAYKAALAYGPDIVIIKLGTNDCKPPNWKHASEFAADYGAMIEAFRSLKSKPKIYVCLPIPVYWDRWGITDAVINKDVIPATRGVAKAAGATLIDLNTPMKGKGDLAPDGVHPNAAGAAIIAETVAGAIAVPAKKR